jgi:hypothetical protein
MTIEGLTPWRVDLARRVTAAVSTVDAPWGEFAYPPPSLTPPAVVVLVGANYVTGPRRTGCLLDTEVTVRLVTDVHESGGAFESLDAAVEAALGALVSFATVNVGARTYGESRWWCADIVVDDVVAIAYNPAPTLVDAVPREG